MDLIAIVDEKNFSNLNYRLFVCVNCSKRAEYQLVGKRGSVTFNGDGKNRYPHSSPLDFGEPF